MKQLSVKLRVTLFYTAILAVILSVVLGFVFLALDLRLVYSSKANLEDAVKNAFDHIDFKGGQLEIDSRIGLYHDGITLVLYGPTGTLLLGSAPAGFPEETPLISDFHQSAENGGQKWQVYDLYIGYGDTGVWVRGVYSLSASASVLNSVTIVAAVCFPLVLLLSAAGGYLITKRAFRPVDRIIEAANRISGGRDLSERLPSSSGSDEIARLAQSFNAMLDRLEGAFEREKQFTSDASHELRTPIAAILSQADFALASPNLPQEIRQALNAIRDQSGKMSALAAQLLELTRADSQTLLLEKERVDLSSLCATVAEELEEQAQARGIRIQCRLDPDITLLGDQTLLIRLVINLVANAIRYGKENGFVCIRLRKTEGAAMLSVTDDGIGIAPEHLNRIFDRFYRADPARRSSQNAGAGLGLSMVQWIVQAHGATISVESELGKGSTFLIRFPEGQGMH